MPTDTIAVSWSSTSGAQSASGSISDFGNSEATIVNQTFGANTNSGNFALNFNANSVQVLFFTATQNCTINTNNANAPTNSVSLVAGIPLYWERSSGYFANPFNANTNAGFLTCTAATTLNVRTLST